MKWLRLRAVLLALALLVIPSVSGVAIAAGRDTQSPPQADPYSKYTGTLSPCFYGLSVTFVTAQRVGSFLRCPGHGL
jgi:hypothetical protein